MLNINERSHLLTPRYFGAPQKLRFVKTVEKCLINSTQQVELSWIEVTCGCYMQGVGVIGGVNWRKTNKKKVIEFLVKTLWEPNVDVG